MTKMNRNTENMLQRDADYFDQLVAEMDEETRDAYLEWVNRICEIMRERRNMPFGEKSAKHLIVRVADYLNYLETRPLEPRKPVFYQKDW